MSQMRANPMAGPAYVVALRNALERRSNEYTTPPRTGGTQISTRLDEFVLNHVEAVVEECGWNRAEVLYALVQRGLFDLYEFVSPDVVDRIVQRIVGRIAPPQPPVAPLSRRPPLPRESVMREPKTADQLKEMVEQRLGRGCFIEIQTDAVHEWRALVVSNLAKRQELQEQADLIVQDLRGQYLLKIRRVDAQAILRDELRHPAAFVQIVGDSPINYRVEVRGADANAQEAAESIFARLKRTYDIE